MRRCVLLGNAPKPPPLPDSTEKAPPFLQRERLFCCMDQSFEGAYCSTSSFLIALVICLPMYRWPEMEGWASLSTAVQVMST